MSGMLMKKCCCVKPCSFCTGATPKTWTVSVTGVDTNFPCVFQGSSPNRNFKGYGDALGTYTLAQDPLHGCVYNKTTTGPRVDSHTQAFGGDTSCSPTVTLNGLFLQLNVTTTDTQLRASWINPTGTPLTVNATWFNSSTLFGGGGGSHDCTATVNLTNFNTVYINNAGSGDYGIHGTAVCTPNF